MGGVRRGRGQVRLGGEIVLYPALAACASEFSEGCVPAKKRDLLDGLAHLQGEAGPFFCPDRTDLLQSARLSFCERDTCGRSVYCFDFAVVDSPYMGVSSFLPFFMFRHPAALGDARSSNVEELVLSNYDPAERDWGSFEAFRDFKRYSFV